MDLPESLTPVRKGKKKTKVSTHILNSYNRESGEVYNALFKNPSNINTEMFKVKFDNIRFKNDNFALTHYDYIKVDDVYYDFLENHTFLQSTELAEFIKNHCDEIPNLDFSYNATYSSVNLIAKFSSVDDVSVILSYNLARLLNMETEFLVEDGDYNTGVITPFIENYKIVCNFGKFIYSGSDSYHIIYSGSFEEPARIINVSGGSFEDSYKSEIVISFIDDRGHFLKINSDFEMTLTFYAVEKEGWYFPTYDNKFVNLFKRRPDLQYFDEKFLEEIEDKYPDFLTKAENMTKLWELNEEISNYIPDDEYNNIIKFELLSEIYNLSRKDLKKKDIDMSGVTSQYYEILDKVPEIIEEKSVEKIIDYEKVCINFLKKVLEEMKPSFDKKLKSYLLSSLYTGKSGKYNEYKAYVDKICQNVYISNRDFIFYYFNRDAPMYYKVENGEFKIENNNTLIPLRNLEFVSVMNSDFKVAFNFIIDIYNHVKGSNTTPFALNYSVTCEEAYKHIKDGSIKNYITIE